jgi:type I restriction enzyme S subunit
MGEWNSCTLGEVLTLQRGFDLPNQKRNAGSFPVVASTGIVGYHDEAKVPAPGVVIGRSGSIGGGQYLNVDFWPLNTTLWVKDFHGNNERYCYYLLKSLDFSVFNVGSGVPTLNRNHVHPWPVLHPLRKEQDKIVEVLGSLDDKIELNRRTNETLEKMAQALFRDWFVDFGPVRRKMEGARDPADIMGSFVQNPDEAARIAALFPATIGDNGLPEGWRKENLESVADQIAMGPFGSNIKVETFVESGIPVISGTHLKHTRLEDGNYNFVSREHAAKLARSNVRRGDVIFTHAGNIGQVAIIPERSKYSRYVISQRQFYLRCNPELMSPLFVVHFFKSHIGQHVLLANSSQVGVPSIARPSSYLKSIVINCPPMEILHVFDAHVSLLHVEASQNDEQNQTLAQTRDYLLPKLMSGRIHAGAAETMVA